VRGAKSVSRSPVLRSPAPRCLRRRALRRAAWALLLAAGLVAADVRRDGFDVVVIDAGHGGDDEGARGSADLVEKDLVLDLARRLAERLRAAGLRVVLTRDSDVTLPLEARTRLANQARGDLFVSIHANAASEQGARGGEVYFLSLEASDEPSRQLAARENAAFATGAVTTAGDPLLDLLGDLVATEHMLESNEFALLAERELAAADETPSRGVKQAPFVVLAGVQMPAALVEVGFVTNRREAERLVGEAGRERIADALARAVRVFGDRYDARRGLAREAPEAPAAESPRDGEGAGDGGAVEEAR
jgi:N-acetylmuramoyl-L-alanine amidase